MADHGHMLYGDRLGFVRDVPWKLSGESFDGSGPALPHCQPMRTLYVDHTSPESPALNPYPYTYDSSSVPGSRIPRSRGSVAGGVSPLETSSVTPGLSPLSSPNGKGAFFGRIRANR